MGAAASWSAVALHRFRAWQGGGAAGILPPRKKAADFSQAQEKCSAQPSASVLSAGRDATALRQARGPPLQKVRRRHGEKAVVSEQKVESPAKTISP